ncbi:MAG: tetratricopeptide repeat protein [Acidobacteria bacterium]|nr:tetratricopeptide repeat protein [Acidobacteriota bacterium]
MNKNNILFGIIGLLAGFMIGFIFANSVARPATGAKPAQASAKPPTAQNSGQNGAQQSGQSGADPQTLSEDEVKRAIAAGDEKPDDIELQHKLGLALYRYASYTQDARYLPDVARFLKRAYDANPNDRDLTVTLGNVLFDIAQKDDPSRFAEARVYYLKALEMKSADADVRTDLGLTYYFGKPSDPQKAIAEYRKSLAIDPRHEATLQNLAAALIVTGNHAEAEKRIAELQSVNPENASLSDLRAQLAQSKNAQE